MARTPTFYQDVPVKIQAGNVVLEGNLTVPENASGMVLFAHGSGSGRFSPRNRFVAAQLNQAGLGTLLFDLLTEAEEVEDQVTRQIRFNVTLLANRLIGVTDWMAQHHDTRHLPIGYFGASTGAAAALIAATARPEQVEAVVSRGGRPDMAGNSLGHVLAPTLLLVGGDDTQVIILNQEAYELLPENLAKRLEIIPGASHLFEEPGTLEEVARLATQWFRKYLNRALP